MILNKKWEAVFLSAVFLFVILFSLSHLTTRPALWFDEGLNIEIAHNFLLFKKLDITTAPGVFSGYAFDVGTSGYPLSLPLAGFFKVFGFGFAQGRIFMLLWMLLALGSVYYVLRTLLNVPSAMFAVALVASFASFYGNGLTVMGDVPGFVFFIWGIFFILRNNFWLAGFFFGFSVAAKPSLHLLVFPAVFIFLLIRERKNFFQKLFKFAVCAAPPVFVWVAWMFPEPFSLSTWRDMLTYYENPYATPTFYNISQNISLLFSHSTLIYFSVLSLILLASVFLKNKLTKNETRGIVFSLLYGVFAFVYFLKSAGWLRYLSSIEFLILIFLYPALLAVFSFIKIKRLAEIFILALLVFQFFHLFFWSDIRESNLYYEIASFVNSENPVTVGIFDLPQVAAFIPAEKKYHVTRSAFIPQMGENPLSFPLDKLPELLVFGKETRGDRDFVLPHRNILENNYVLIKEIGRYQIFRRT